MDALKPNKKYEQLFAIVRYESESDPDAPIEYRVTVKKVVANRDYAEAEVKRLNDLNEKKGSYYFCQLTRFEDELVLAQPVAISALTQQNVQQT